MSKPNYDVDVEIGKEGNISINQKEKYQDGATTIYNALESLKNAKNNQTMQIKSFKNEIKARKEAIEFTESNIEFTEQKIRKFEKILEELKKRGFEPKVVKKVVSDSEIKTQKDAEKHAEKVLEGFHEKE